MKRSKMFVCVMSALLLVSGKSHRLMAQGPQPVQQVEVQQTTVPTIGVDAAAAPPDVTPVAPVQPPSPPQKKVVKKIASVKIHGYAIEPSGLKTIYGNPVKVPYTLVKVRGESERRFLYKRWGNWQIARDGNADDRIRAISDAKLAQEKIEAKAAQSNSRSFKPALAPTNRK